MRFLCLRCPVKPHNVLYRAACGGGSIVEPYFVVYFREWGRQFGTLGFLTASEIQKCFLFPLLLISWCIYWIME